MIFNSEIIVIGRYKFITLIDNKAYSSYDSVAVDISFMFYLIKQAQSVLVYD